MKLRLPLALKVSVWLLLNLVVLVALAIGLVAYNGGLSWNGLMEGPPGRRVEALVDSSLGDLMALGREEWEDALLDFAKEHGVEAMLVSGPGRVLAGKSREIPVTVREALRAIRPPPEEDREPGKPPKRRLLLLKTGQPPAFWITVPIHHKPGAPPNWVVLRAPSLASLLRLLDLTTWLWLGAGAAAISVLFWLPMVRNLTRDLARLTSATREIANGHLDTRVNASRRDELGALGESVNHMAARLDRMSTGQKRF